MLQLQKAGTVVDGPVLSAEFSLSKTHLIHPTNILISPNLTGGITVTHPSQELLEVPKLVGKVTPVTC